MQIKSIFDKMDYGEAPESAREAQNWLKNHNYIFGNFINGKWKQCEDHFNTINPANDQVLAKQPEPLKKNGPKKVIMRVPAFYMQLRVSCRKTLGFSLSWKPWTMENQLENLVILIFLLLKDTSIIMLEWLN